jgi:hypothetical protein
VFPARHPVAHRSPASVHPEIPAGDHPVHRLVHPETYVSDASACAHPDPSAVSALGRRRPGPADVAARRLAVRVEFLVLALPERRTPAAVPSAASPPGELEDPQVLPEPPRKPQVQQALPPPKLSERVPLPPLASVSM